MLQQNDKKLTVRVNTDLTLDAGWWEEMPIQQFVNDFLGRGEQFRPQLFPDTFHRTPPCVRMDSDYAPIMP